MKKRAFLKLFVLANGFVCLRKALRQTKAIILLIIVLITPCVKAFASETDIYVLESAEAEDGSERLFFLFSSSVVKGEKSTIYAFFSDITLEGDFGVVYSFFSKSIVDEQACGEIKTFSSVVAGANEDYGYVSPLVPWLSFMFERVDSEYSDKMPVWFFMMALGVMQVGICVCLYAIKKSFMEQGSVVLQNEPVHLINYGLSAYTIMLALVVAFVLTVVFIPVSLLLIVVCYPVMLIGETSLAITVGYYASSALKKNYTAKTNLLIGLALIEGMKIVPFIGITFSFLFLPIMSLGTVITAFINWFFGKTFYELPYAPEKTDDIKVFPKEKIRDIILGNKH